MTRLLLVEDVFLLGHDDDSGKNTASLALAGALAGALLLDLTEQGLVTVDDDARVHATDTEAGHPLLGRALEVVRAEGKPRDVSRWLWELPRALKPLDRAVGESLVERGVLGEERGKVLGLFSTTRWPEVDPEPERQLRAELRDALLGSGEPSTRVLLLIALLQHHGLVDRLVDKDERRPARARARELVEQAESGDAVSKALGDSARAAALIVVTTATTAAASAAVISST